MYDLHNLCAFIKDFKMFFVCETERKLKLRDQCPELALAISVTMVTTSLRINPYCLFSGLLGNPHRERK